MKKRGRKKASKTNNHNNNNHFIKQRLTLGQRLSDKLALYAGSWTFIIALFVFLIIWMAINLAAFKFRWDPYPFILLNLFLSCLATVQAPVILMSQNRQADTDRHRFEYDYSVNRKAEREVQALQESLEDIKKLIRKSKKKR